MDMVSLMDMARITDSRKYSSSMAARRMAISSRYSSMVIPVSRRMDLIMKECSLWEPVEHSSL